MNATVVLTPQADGQVSWQGEGLAGCGSVADFAAMPESRQADLVLAVPAQKVLLQEVAFAPHERRLLRKTIPFALEEQLLEDVDTQHFALGPIGPGQVPVAIVQQQWLADWLQRCAQAGLAVKHAVPELLLLPWQPGSWSLWPQAERWLVRVGRWRGFALEADSARLALQILLDDSEQLPERLTIYTEPADAATVLPQWQSQLPELLRGIIDVQPISALTVLPGTSSLDFLQGIFARRLPWRRWWTQWRIPLQAAAAAVFVQFVVAGFQHHQLQKQNLALRQQIEQIYRGVEPSGAMVEPERQLRRKVQALQGSHGGAVMPLLQRLGGAIKSIDGVSIQSLNYNERPLNHNERQSELRLNVIAGSFKDVELLRAAIDTAGLQAQLIGSNADGDKTRAQLRVTERR